MDYKGFISTLIERSEEILMSDNDDSLDVTRLLLVLNTGFSLVRDRINYWDNADDLKLRSANLKKEVRKACKSDLSKPIKIDGKPFFEEFRACNDWAYLRVCKEEVFDKSLSAKKIGQYLAKAELSSPNDLTLDHVMRALRNSFAHGGVMPMSTEQSEQLGIKPLNFIPSRGKHIDRVYFVSDWTETVPLECGHEKHEKVGWVIMEFGLKALGAFWSDWKELILISREEGLNKLDQAA